VLEERKGDNIQFFLYQLFFERIYQKELISMLVRWDAAENSDESQHDKNKIDFFI